MGLRIRHRVGQFVNKGWEAGLGAAPLLNGVTAVALGSIALVPGLQLPEPSLYGIIAGALLFAVLTPISQRRARRRYAKVKEHEHTAKVLDQALSDRADAWWRIARRMRGKTDPQQLLQGLIDCDELSPVASVAPLFTALTDPARYRSDSNARIRAAFWRPMPLDVLLAEDTERVERCVGRLAEIYDRRSAATGDDLRGVYTWVEGNCNRKYVLAARCYDGDRGHYGHRQDGGHLNEVAAKDAVLRELWERPPDEKEPFLAEAFGAIDSHHRRTESAIGQRDARYGLAYSITKSMLAVRLARHSRKPGKDRRRDLLGILVLYADDPAFFGEDDSNEILRRISPFLRALQLLLGESDSMGVIKRRARSKNQQLGVDVVRFGALLTLSGARKEDVRAALVRQDELRAARRHNIPPLGQIYCSVSDDPQADRILRVAERMLAGTVEALFEPRPSSN